MQLSVIILNYNVRYFLEQCVFSVQKALENIDGEIIVVDNHSQDDSCAMMKQCFPNVKLIENKTNSGFPKGNNIGVSVAQGEYICILNPDTVVAEDTFEKVLSFAQKQTDLGIVGVKLIDGTGHFLPESKRGIPTPWVAFTKIAKLYQVFPKSKLFNQYYAQHISENQSGKVEILVGAFMLMKRDLYEEIGGFDENCFMYSDDIDLSYLVLKKNKLNYYFHETTVIHYKGESTIRDGIYMKRFREAMNFFYKKHFKVSFLFSVIMEIGIVFFSFMKRFQGKTELQKPPISFLLISKNNEIKTILETKIKQIINIQTSTDLTEIPSGTEIIFDSNYLDFKSIIRVMESNKCKGLTFKILSSCYEFSIGSNSSFDRGEIMKIIEN